MSKSVSVSSPSEVAVLREQVERAAEHAVNAVRCLVQTDPPLTVLAAMKFDKVGVEPVERHPLNLIEQVNQTFTYLASLDAAEYLLEAHPEHAPFTLNLGTRAGFDVQSADGSIVCEVFAAVRPQNNRKLDKDVTRLHGAVGTHKYVFFMCPGIPPGEQESKYDDVRVMSLGGSDAA